jgi:glyoxylase-like metal-dependent hydrolase (beta-lactamase superfamily II)
MGDDFVTYGFPFVDVGNGGSVSGMIAGCEKVLAMTSAETKFIPGHGPISTPADLRKYVDMLKETREIVSKSLKSGKSVGQIKQEKVLAGFEDLGKGFIKTDAWIDVLYADIHNDR